MAAISGATALSASASVALIGTVTVPITGASTLYGDASVNATGTLLVHLDSTSKLSASSELKASGSLGKDYLSVADVVDEVLILWGIESKENAKDFLRQQAINEINASIQFISSQAKGLDYLGRATRTYALSQNAASVSLEADVQNVIGPVRWVRPVATIEKLNAASPHIWILDIGRAERGDIDMTLTVDGTATVHKTFIEEPGGIDPFTREDVYLESSATPGDYTNNTGRTDQSIDVPGMLKAFEANAKVTAGEISITGSWPRYKIEYSGSHGATLVAGGLGGVRGEAIPLRPIASRGQLESWRQTTGAYQTGHPEYYYISRTKASEKEGTAIALEVRPHPDFGVGIGVGTLSVDVATEPPRFSWSDVALASIIPIPHNYIESLFLPVVRYRATVNQYYVGTQEASASIQTGFQAALAQYEMADPQIKEAEEAVA